MKRDVNTKFNNYTSKLSSLTSAMQNANTKIAQVKSDNAKDTAINYTKSEVNVLKDSISLKVEKSEVDKAVDDATKALTTKINDTKSEIKLTTDSIANRVSSVESTTTSHTTQLGNVDNRLNAVNTEISNTKSKVSAIETNLTGITSRVSSVESKQTTTDGKLSSLETWKSSAEQKITDSAIINTVSKTIDNKVANGINGLEVGGRNLLKDSKLNKTTTDYHMCTLYFGDAKPKEGEVYTIAIKGTLASAKQHFGIYNSGGAVQITTVPHSTRGSDGVYRHTFTWKVGSSANTYISIYQMQSSASGSSTITWVKLEKGSKSTDWTPAPEDVQGQLTTHTSQITQLSNSIELKVSKDSVVSAINVSPETIKLKSSKIDMTGKLDLNGTFTCYQDGTNKKGNYLYQNGAMHRGYLSDWHKPVYSSGIWKPDGVNDVGYVSVGWSDSDACDANGCLWMSPRVYGGGSLHYGVWRDGARMISGIDYYKDGSVWYTSSMNYKTNYNYYAHKFDGNIQVPCLYATNFISCGGTIRCDSTIYSDKSDLYMMSGGYENKYFLQFNKGGYLYGKGVQLGNSSQPFYQLYCTYAPSITSDGRKKEDVKYLSNTQTLSDDSDSLSLNDMYEYVKELKIATYKLKESREVDKDKVELGFIAQDVVDTKVGKYVIDSSDEDNLVYSLSNRITVIEGALQKLIKDVEEMKESMK